MNRKILIADVKRCTGCRICELICSFSHEKVFSPTLSRVRIVKWEKEGIDIPVFCVQCEHPPCEEICPVKAIYRDEKTGAMLTDENVCIGCRICVEVCPFGATIMHLEKGVALRCDLCHGYPSCAKWCPEKVIKYVDVNVHLGVKRRKAVEEYSKLIEKTYYRGAD